MLPAAPRDVSADTRCRRSPLLQKLTVSDRGWPCLTMFDRRDAVFNDAGGMKRSVSKLQAHACSHWTRSVAAQYSNGYRQTAVIRREALHVAVAWAVAAEAAALDMPNYVMLTALQQKQQLQSITLYLLSAPARTSETASFTQLNLKPKHVIITHL